MPKGNWFKRWELVIGDPEKDGSITREEWGATLHEEKKIHINPHALIPEHRRELLATTLHEAMHVTNPSMTEDEVEKISSRLADFFIANPHMHSFFARYKPIKTNKKCPCEKK